MRPTKPGNTQVYSPFGSFVVEQHGETRHDSRSDSIKKRYEGHAFGSERGIAIIWTVVIAAFLVGSIYNRLGRPDIAATTSAKASMHDTAGALNRSKD